MPRKSLTLYHYNGLAEKSKCQLVGDVPNRATIPTQWVCLVCGRNLNKSYNAMKYHSICVCRSEMVLKREDYQALAERLGVKWLGQYPPNSKVVVSWSGTSGVFLASYHQLAYGFISQKLRKAMYG